MQVIDKLLCFVEELFSLNALEDIQIKDFVDKNYLKKMPLLWIETLEYIHRIVDRFFVLGFFSKVLILFLLELNEIFEE